MPRHLGTLIDLRAGTIRGRDGSVVPAERLEVGKGVVYTMRSYQHHPRLRAMERWTIAERGWAIARFHPLEGEDSDLFTSFDWYIDIDRTEISADGATWTVEDRYLDLLVEEGTRYRLLDADELADALAAGDITPVDACAALRDLQSLVDELRDNGYSVAALLDRYAPGLPR